MGRIIQGDALEVLKTLPDEFVQCVVTSPPYWGLRDYQADGQLGLEKTPEEYVGKMVAVFQEVRRVLRDDGVVFLNLGDSYTSGNRPDRDPGPVSKTGIPHRSSGMERAKTPPGLKPKDLVGIPWRVAFALQADGWWLRQDIVWAKPNPMPESVTDRCTKAHEYFFLLTKSARYYWDQEAVKETTERNWATVGGNLKGKGVHKVCGEMKDVGDRTSEDSERYGRNRRSVWTITTQPSSEPHFAQFPEKLVEPCVLAGTSEKGACPKCGKGWVRVVEKEGMSSREWQALRGTGTKGHDKKMGMQGKSIKGGRPPDPTSKTLGWQPACSCGEKPVPCVVLDPFCGLGTACIVAKKLGRDYIGIDISEKYCKIAERKLAATGYQYALNF